jgi:predicted nucleotidyltransferase
MMLRTRVQIQKTSPLAGCVALLLSACGSSPQSLIVGKWEVASAKAGGAEVVGSADAIKAIKMSAEFSGDGTAKITMFGQTLRGNYKFDGSDLEWTLNGITTKSKANVTATELDLTDEANRTITYKRK